MQSWQWNFIFFAVGGILLSISLGPWGGLGACLLALYITGKLERPL